MYYIFWVCVCSLSIQRANAQAPYSHLWPVPLYHIFPHYLINGTIFPPKNVCFDFLYNFNLKQFSFQEVMHEIWSKMYIGLYVKYRLFLSDFRKIIKYQIPLKSVHWEPSCSTRTDRRTDVTKVRVAFSQIL